MKRTVAIIGAGIGAQHLAGYAALPERFRVKTVCDLDETRGRNLADKCEGTGFTTDVDEVLSDPEIDIVDVCLPPHLHCQACLGALDAGKDVVCEKPLACSLSEADRLIERSRRAGGKIFPVFQYRYGPGMTQLRMLIDSGIAGRCYAGTLETHWDRPESYYDIGWRGTWAGEQGGAVLGHAIHIHDLLMSLLGPVAQVFADVATRVNNIEVEDCAALSVRMCNGTLVTSSITLGAAGNTSRLRLMFEGFTVESDHAPYAPAAKSWTFIARNPVRQRDIDAMLAGVPETRTGYEALFEAMADALDGNPGREVTLEDGRQSIEFATAIYGSARSGQPEELPIRPGHPFFDGWAN